MGRVVALTIFAGARFAGDVSVTIQTDGLGMSVGMLGMIVNRENLNAMYNSFKTAYNNAFAGVTPMWNKIATLVPSSVKQENYGWMGSFPSLREWISDR